MRRVLVFAGLIGGLWLLVLTATMNFARQEEPKQWMIYVSDGYLYRSHPDGSEIQQLTDYRVNFAEEAFYQVSFGERWIIYTQFDGNGFVGLYRTDITGQNPHYLRAWGREDDLQGFSDDGQIIVVKRYEIGRELLMVTHADGGQWQITINHGDFISFSPDNEWLLFTDDRDENLKLFLINRDGEGLRQLSDRNGVPLGWSSDGEWLYYARYLENSGTFYRIQIDSGQLQRLTDESRAIYFQAWFPDHQWLLVASPENDHRELFRMRSDGTELQQLTFTEIDADNHYIAWGPNGQWFVYAAILDRGESRIYRMNWDGSDRRFLTTANPYIPADYLSPDGNWLAHQAFNANTNFKEVYVVSTNPNAAEALQITTDDRRGYFETWSPDSEWIYFTEFASVDASRRQLFRIRPDGTDRQQVTHQLGPYQYTDTQFLAWSPIVELAWSRALLMMGAVVSIVFAMVLSIFSYRRG